MGRGHPNRAALIAVDPIDRESRNRFAGRIDDSLMGAGIVSHQPVRPALKRAHPEGAVGLRFQSIHGEVAHGIRGPKLPAAASLGAVIQAPAGADPQVTGAVAHDAPDGWIGKSLFLGEALPLFAPEPARHSVAAVADPKRTLAVFQRTDHFGAPQTAFQAVI